MTANRPLPKASIMLSLRAATRVSHANIEQVSCLRRMFEPGYALTDYAKLLGRLYGFYSVIEPVLFADDALQREPMLRHRAKTPLLFNDLAALGMTAAAIEALPRCAAPPPLRTSGHCLGTLYVLEGATLGGQLIHRRLLEHFGPAIASSMHFYGSYGDRIGAEWRAFSDFMNTRFADPAGADTLDALTAANATFEALTAWLEERG